MTDTSIDVFVYGTLKPGESNYRVCESCVLTATPAIAYGRLYALPFGYPAMTLSATTPSTDVVYGVLLSFAEATILNVLDAYEQHDPEAFRHYMPNLLLAQNQYDRTQIETYDHAQRFLGLAWSYVMSSEQIQRLAGIRLLGGQWHQPQKNCSGSLF